METVRCADCGEDFETEPFNVGTGGDPLCEDCRPDPHFPWEEDDG